LRGSISKHVARDGTPTYRVRITLRDPASGQRTQPQRTYRTRKDAESGLREWLRELEQGGPVHQTRQSTREYLEWWLADVAAGQLKPTTLSSYRWMVRTYALPRIGAVPLARLNAQGLQSLYADLSRDGKSPRTIQYLHVILHRALREAVRLGLLSRNVADACSPPHPRTPEAKAWSPCELARFLDVARADPYWPLWLLAPSTGLRRSALLGLRWADVELEGKRPALQIRQSVVRVDGKLEVQAGGKRGGQRVSLDAPCVAALRAHRARQNEERLLLGPLWEDHDLIFCGPHGRPLHPSTMARHLDKLAQEAGVPRLTIHQLRHTHATILMLAGVHPKVVAERLGHADIAITLRTYSHVLGSMHEQAAEIFAATVARERDQEHA
jgi:integrase